MDAFIHGNTQTATTASGNINANPSLNVNTQTHLPESPPDSGSEPPYSPSDLHGAAGIVTTGTTNQQSTNGYETDIRLGHLGPHLGQQQTTTGLHVSDLTLSQQLLSDPTNNIYLNGGGTSPSQNLVDGGHQSSGLIVVPEVTLKHEGELIIPEDASSEYMLHSTGGTASGVTLIELGQRSFKNDLLEASTGDDLVQLMPGVYNASTGVGSVSTNNNSSSSSNNGIQSPHVRQSAATRKRKGSNSVAGRPPSTIIKTDPDLSSGVTRMISKSCSNDTSLDTINNASLDSSSSTNGGGDGSDSCPMQSIRFAPFQQHQWHVLCNQNLQEL